MTHRPFLGMRGVGYELACAPLTWVLGASRMRRNASPAEAVTGSDETCPALQPSKTTSHDSRSAQIGCLAGTSDHSHAEQTLAISVATSRSSASVWAPSTSKHPIGSLDDFWRRGNDARSEICVTCRRDTCLFRWRVFA